MVAPPSSQELSLLIGSSKMADKEALAQLDKRKQLLAANKQKARELLLGISTASYTTSTKIDNYNGK